MSIPENPPAFPNTGNANWGLAADEGMSLRDWFAGQAPPPADGFTIPPPECGNWDDSELSRRAWSDWNLRRAVAWANAWADAMLAERSKS